MKTKEIETEIYIQTPKKIKTTIYLCENCEAEINPKGEWGMFRYDSPELHKCIICRKGYFCNRCSQFTVGEKCCGDDYEPNEICICPECQKNPGLKDSLEELQKVHCELDNLESKKLELEDSITKIINMLKFK